MEEKNNEKKLLMNNTLINPPSSFSFSSSSSTSSMEGGGEYHLKFETSSLNRKMLDPSDELFTERIKRIFFSYQREIGQMKTLILLCLVYVFGYGYVRNTVNFTLPILTSPISEGGLGYSNTQAGVLTGCGIGGYAVGKFLNGVLVDVLGAKLMFIGSIMIALILNVIFAYIEEYRVMIGIWFGVSYFTSAAWAAMTKMICVWFEPSRQGRAFSLISLSAEWQYILIAINLGYLMNNHSFGYKQIALYNSFIAFIFTLIGFLFLRSSPPPSLLPPSSTHIILDHSDDDDDDHHQTDIKFNDNHPPLPPPLSSSFPSLLPDHINNKYNNTNDEEDNDNEYNNDNDNDNENNNNSEDDNKNDHSNYQKKEKIKDKKKERMGAGDLSAGKAIVYFVTSFRFWSVLSLVITLTMIYEFPASFLPLYISQVMEGISDGSATYLSSLFSLGSGTSVLIGGFLIDSFHWRGQSFFFISSLSLSSLSFASLFFFTYTRSFLPLLFKLLLKK